MSDIAPLVETKTPDTFENLKLGIKAIGRLLKYSKIMFDAGVTFDLLMQPINDLRARANFAAFVRAGYPALPTPKLETKPTHEPPKPAPIVVELGIFEFDRDESILQKLAAITDPKAIGYRTPLATDENFPDARSGTVRMKASAVSFGKLMSQEDIEAWCAETKRILALPKDGIDIAKVSPRPKLDSVMPLAMAGQFFVDADGNRGGQQSCCLNIHKNVLTL